MGKKSILRCGLFLRALASGRNWRESEEICLDSRFHQHLSYCRNDALHSDVSRETFISTLVLFFLGVRAERGRPALGFTA